MLAGEIAFSSSTMKRLVEQSANDPESSKTQVFAFLLSHSNYKYKLLKKNVYLYIFTDRKFGTGNRRKKKGK